MFHKIKALFATFCMITYTNFMKFLYKKELKEFESLMTSTQKARRDSEFDSFKKEAKAMPPDQKAILDQYAMLQNEIFKAFLIFTNEIQQSEGVKMDDLAKIWVTTVNGLNKTITHAFEHESDTKIKQHFDALDKELQMAIDTNQEVINSKVSNGGFGYNGPIGEA